MITKKEINDILLKMQSGELCIGQAADELMEMRTERRFARRDLNGLPVFEHDTVEWQVKGGMYLNSGKVLYDEDMCAFVILSDTKTKSLLPILSECNIFSLVKT